MAGMRDHLNAMELRRTKGVEAAVGRIRERSRIC
jgi:hypothetical protein